MAESEDALNWERVGVSNFEEGDEEHIVVYTGRVDVKDDAAARLLLEPAALLPPDRRITNAREWAITLERVNGESGFWWPPGGGAGPHHLCVVAIVLAALRRVHLVVYRVPPPDEPQLKRS